MSEQIDRLNAALTGRYRIERELGAGGMATVYLAEDLKHDRKVAIKVLKPELAAVLGAERFVVEIKTTAAMSHPHILPLFDSGTADGFLYYVMPYIEGETIREKLNRETQFGIDEAIRIAREIADALDYAHRHGVIHRDIKPENILLHDGRAMVMDFGIALAVSAAAGGRMTESGLSLGTPHYMSPEQATAEKEITARSDVYSLASVLYEMLAGQPPHTGGAAQQVIMRIITEPARPVTEFRKNVPANVGAALAKALEKLPADRFESAKLFSDALANPAFTVGALSGAAVPSRVAGGVSARAYAATLVVGALAIGAAWMLAGRGETTASQPEFHLAIPTRGIVPGGREQSLAISRDGRAVAFVGIAGGIARLYLRGLGDDQARALAGTEGAKGVTFSPDGRWLLFATSDRHLRKVPVDGGAVVSLATIENPVGLSWSERFGPVLGMITFSLKNPGLSTIVEGGDSVLHPVTTGTLTGGPNPRAGMHHFPVVLDDGYTVLFTQLQSQRNSLGVVSLSGGSPELIDLDIDRVIGVADGMLVFIDRGKNLMAVGFDAGRRRLTGVPVRVGNFTGTIADAALSRNGTLALLLTPAAYQAVVIDEHGVGEPIFADTVTEFLPRFSPDGRRIAFRADMHHTEDNWVVDLATHALTRLPVLALVNMGLIDWSPDGRRVLTDSSGYVRWQQDDGAGAATKALESKEFRLFVASVSPDGRAIAVGTGFGAHGFDVIVQPVGGGAAIPFAATDANERQPRFSPDGRWIAYSSDASGKYEAYIKPYPGPGAAIQVSADGGDAPTWSKDGKRLFYRNGQTMMVADLTGGATPAVAKRERLFDGDYLVDSYDGQMTYDVAPDGKHFVAARAVNGGGAELQVWTGWLPELKKRLASAK